MTNITPIQAVEAAVAASSSISQTTGVDFSSYLDTEKSFENIFQEAAQTYNVSVDLLKAIAKQESNFNPNATSRSGAQGVMQLMPRTAESLGVTDSYDPYQNIMGGAKYIRKMLDMYNGDTTLALAAYNAGCNNVDKYGGVPPFEETQNYVVKVNNYFNEGVTVPEDVYATGNTVNGDSQVTYGDLNDFAGELLAEIFSYDDYMKLLNSLLGKSRDDMVLSMNVLDSSKANVNESPSPTEKTEGIPDSVNAYEKLSSGSALCDLLLNYSSNA